MAGLLDGQGQGQPGLLGNIGNALWAYGTRTHPDELRMEQQRQQILKELGPNATMGDVANRLRQMGDFKGFMSVSQLADAQTHRNTTDDIREFEYAKKQGFTGSLQDWMQRKRAGAGEYALNPTWGTGPDGQPAIVQLGKGGEAISPKLPAGFSPSKGVEKVDLGDSWGFMNKQTGETLRVVPKNIEAKEAAEEEGKAVGQARVNLPKIESSVNQTLATIEQIRKHPGKDSWAGGVGWGSVIPPMPSSQGVGFVSLVNQLKGKTFLQAFETLKGGGAITETEGTKGEQAIARLDRAQSPKDFEQALKDLEDVVVEGRRVAREKAAGRRVAPAPATPSTATPAPQMDSPAISEARTAIAKGAPKDKVIQRLREKGVKFNPADLDL